MNVMTPKFGMGASVLRKEDNAFIQGAGRYNPMTFRGRGCCTATCCVRRLQRELRDCFDQGGRREGREEARKAPRRPFSS